MMREGDSGPSDEDCTRKLALRRVLPVPLRQEFFEAVVCEVLSDLLFALEGRDRQV